MDRAQEIEIRKVALEAAIEFAKPLGAVAPEDLLYAADIFAAYLAHGPEEALRVDFERGRPRRSTTEPVELRERESSKPPPPRPEVAAVPDREVSPAREAPKGDPEGNRKALSRIEKIRKDRAEGILRQAKVAKAPEHRRKLLREAEESGVVDLVVNTPEGRKPLGEYLRPLPER